MMTRAEGVPIDVRMTDMQIETLHRAALGHHTQRDIPSATAELDPPIIFDGQLFIDGDIIEPGTAEVTAFNYHDMTARIAGRLASQREFEADISYYESPEDHKNSQLVIAKIR